MKEKNSIGKKLNPFWTVTIATLLIAAGIVSVLMVSNDSWENQNEPNPLLSRFSSYEELKEYVKSTRNQRGYAYEGGDALFLTSASPSTAGASADSGFSAKPDYSSTNIQVEGVDEADIVKTDGRYIYVVSGNEVVIVQAYPADEARIISRIVTDNEPIELFINGQRLVVFESPRTTDSYWYDMTREYYRPQPAASQTTIKIYDISMPSNPVLIRSVSTSGYYFDSRMIGEYVYAITSEYLRFVEDDVILPVLEKEGVQKRVEATEIGYFGTTAPSYSFTTIFSVDIKNEGVGYDVYLTDAAQHMYASTENIYLTSNDYSYSAQKTWIHKVSIDSGQIQYLVSAEVPGRVLNQFSMDEYNGHFRIATHEWGKDTKVHVLNDELDAVGKLEGIAPGEQMHSARFMGDRCYLVTFKKVDPFFVIDLEIPYAPKVLGELKIPGYSDYLHPYDENHIIGIGKDTADMGSFAWYQGVKMSLFDVTDVENPKEMAKYIIGDRGTDSYALRDHKAFLFSYSKNLLIIPVDLAEIDESKYPNGVPPNASGEHVWQGAYVFRLTLEKGFELKGRITHIEDTGELGNSGYYYSSPHSIKRSLYIDKDIYTVSQKMIKMNSMDTLQEVNKITISA